MTSPADTDLFIAKKTAQWERIAGTQPGLQLVQSGKTQAFTLIKSVDEFYEGVLIGQIASVKRVAEKVGKRTHYRVLREDEKAVDKRGVDLTKTYRACCACLRWFLRRRIFSRVLPSTAQRACNLKQWLAAGPPHQSLWTRLPT